MSNHGASLHDANPLSSTPDEDVCAPPDDSGLHRAYHARVVTRIGPKQPRRNFLAKWRLKRELTQEQLADRVGTHKAQVSNWENNKRAMSFAVQSALAEALDIEPSDLFRDPDRPSADELLRDASPETVKEAIEIIRVLVSRRAS